MIGGVQLKQRLCWILWIARTFQDHPITTIIIIITIITISSSNPRYNHHHHHHHVFTNAEDVRLSGSLGGETQKF